MAILALGLLGVALAGVERETLSTEIKVVFTDRKLTVRPPAVEPGPVTFVVFNKGRQPRVFALRGPGVDGVRIRTVKPGHVATMYLRVRAGRYLLWDRALGGDSHAKRFMVRPPAAPGEFTHPPSRPPTNEIAPTGVGCDV